MLSALYENHWLPLWVRINAHGDPYQSFLSVMTRYHEPHRAYHTIDHIDFVVKTADRERVRELCKNHNAVLFALFLHDAVYDTYASDNEEKSADVARNLLQDAGVHEGFISEVRRLILATKHAGAVEDIDAQVVVDIDLSILGAPPYVFDKYERDIRKEYAWVPEADFRFLRKAILEKFLDRAKKRTLFHTRFAQAAWGEAVCDNLEASIKALS